MPDGVRRTISVTGKVVKDEESGDTILATVSSRHPIMAALREGKGSVLGTTASWMTLKGAAEMVGALLSKCS